MIGNVETSSTNRIKKNYDPPIASLRTLPLIVCNLVGVFRFAVSLCSWILYMHTPSWMRISFVNTFIDICLHFYKDEGMWLWTSEHHKEKNLPYSTEINYHQSVSFCYVRWNILKNRIDDDSINKANSTVKTPDWKWNVIWQLIDISKRLTVGAIF